jgi:enolase
VEASGYKAGADVQIALDVAASELFKDGKYKIEGETKTSEQMIEFYQKLIQDYPIISIEDPLAEEDWAGFTQMTRTLGEKIQIVGDEGGVAPNLSSTREALDVVIDAVEASGYKAGADVQIALDVAASELFKDGKYKIEGETKTSEQMIEFYQKLIQDYPRISI